MSVEPIIGRYLTVTILGLPQSVSVMAGAAA